MRLHSQTNQSMHNLEDAERLTLSERPMANLRRAFPISLWVGLMRPHPSIPSWGSRGPIEERRHEHSCWTRFSQSTPWEADRCIAVSRWKHFVRHDTVPQTCVATISLLIFSQHYGTYTYTSISSGKEKRDVIIFQLLTLIQYYFLNTRLSF